MENPDKVAKLILYAPWWKGNAELNEFRRKRMENGGKPLPQYRDVTEDSMRSDFIRGDLAQHPQFEADVVDELVKEVLKANPQAPNTFVENAHLAITASPRLQFSLHAILSFQRICKGTPKDKRLAGNSRHGSYRTGTSDFEEARV